MARALDAIISELNNVYNPQRDVYKSQLDTLDPSMQAEQKGLEAAKNDAFGQITNQANRRGLFYSGIPVAEEQRYTGATYLPAVANLRSRYAQQRFNLQDALAKITQNQYMNAQSIYQAEQERAAQAAQGSGFNPSIEWLTNVLNGQYRNWPTSTPTLDEIYANTPPLNLQTARASGGLTFSPTRTTKTTPKVTSPATGQGLNLTQALGASLYR